MPLIELTTFIAAPPEVVFVGELLERTDSLLLLDLANVYANALNLGESDWLARVPVERLAYVHMAGGVMRDGIYHDSHAHEVSAPVLALLKAIACRCGVDGVPGVMLERDDDFPVEAALNAELDAVAAAGFGNLQRMTERATEPGEVHA